MPIRLNVGVSKKLGLPRYSSVGVSCALEVELSSTLLDQGSDAFHERVNYIYRACREAVEEELARQQALVADVSGEASCRGGVEEESIHGRLQDKRHGQADDGPSGHGRGSSGNGNDRGPQPLLATAQQLEYAHDLAAQIDGLTEGDLETLSQQVCGRPLTELSRRDASMLIGTLLEILDGEIALDILLGRGGAGAQPS